MGTQEIFIQYIKEHEALIYKIARVYSATPEDLEDLYQEIVYQAWKSFASFRQDSRFSTWLYRIALNTSITHSARSKRSSVQELGDIHIHYADPHLEEQVEMLYSEVSRLDKIEKAIVLLYLEGRSYEEIASITGFSATNIGTRLSRIRLKLKKQINK